MRRRPVFADPKTGVVFQRIFGSDDHSDVLQRRSDRGAGAARKCWPIWNALVRHNARNEFPLDVVRVGDPPDLPLSVGDPERGCHARAHCVR